MDLTKARRNEIFHAVAQGGLDVAECELAYAKSLIVVHPPTDSRFEAKKDTGNYSYRSRIGTDPITNWTFFPVDWPRILGEIEIWSARVVRWNNTPDLWELKNNWQFLSSQQYEDSDNTPFTAGEQDAISAQLIAIRETIQKTYQLTAEQAARIDNQFKEAEKASKRLGRKDWFLLFGGCVLSLIATDAITPGIAEHILMMAAHGLEHLFTAGPRSIAAE